MRQENKLLTCIKNANPVLTQTAHDSLSAKLKWDRWVE